MRSDPTATRFVGLPDLHGIFGDPEAVECAMAFIRATKPDLVVGLGDAVDCYQMSRFDQSPARALDLQRDFDAGRDFYRSVRKHAKHAKIVALAGNHEDRLRRWLWSKGAAAVSLRSMRIPELLGLSASKVYYYADGLFRAGGLLFKHGSVVRSHSAYSARAELEREGVSGCSGHTHRIGEFSHTTRGGFKKWVEAGCLCKLNPEYMDGQLPNWQQGLAYGTFMAGGRFALHTAHIIGGKTVYGDRVIAAQ